MSVPFDGTKTGKGVALQGLHEISQTCAMVAYEDMIRASLYLADMALVMKKPLALLFHH